MFFKHKGLLKSNHLCFCKSFLSLPQVIKVWRSYIEAQTVPDCLSLCCQTSLLTLISVSLQTAMFVLLVEKRQLWLQCVTSNYLECGFHCRCASKTSHQGTVHDRWNLFRHWLWLAGEIKLYFLLITKQTLNEICCPFC